MTSTVSVNESYLLHLIACALDGSVPKAASPSVSMPTVYRLAEAHGVRALTFYALDKISDLSRTSPLYLTWLESYQRAIVRDATQQMEYEAMQAAFKQKGLPYFALKGLIIKSEYPLPELREMSDLDLLLTKADLKKAEPVMVSLGYTRPPDHADHHDVYYKLPIMNVELHQHLNTDRRWVKAHYASLLKEAASVGRVGSIPMACEDVYLHLVIHAAEHLKEAGIGIRQFIDLYLYRKHHALNEERIGQLLDQCGYRTLEQWLQRFSKLWFEGIPISAEGIHEDTLHKMERYFLLSTVYGTAQQKQHHAAIETDRKYNSLFLAKIRNFFGALFPPRSVMAKQYPVLRSVPILLPVFWIVRIFRSLFKTRTRARKTITRFSAITDQSFSETKEILNTLFHS